MDDMMIRMDPEIGKKFHESDMITKIKGASNFMKLESYTRRRAF